jgi:hypothetical protein
MSAYSRCEKYNWSRVLSRKSLTSSTHSNHSQLLAQIIPITTPSRKLLSYYHRWSNETTDYRRLATSYSPPWEPEISHRWYCLWLLESQTIPELELIFVWYVQEFCTQIIPTLLPYNKTVVLGCSPVGPQAISKKKEVAETVWDTVRMKYTPLYVYAKITFVG